MIVIVALAVAGCSDGATGSLIPGATVDALARGPGGAVASDDARPCGYDLTLDASSGGRPPVRSHQTARMTYNPAGLAILEEGVDDTGGFAFRYTTAYNAMGDTTYIKAELVDLPTVQLWQVYDSFGRMIRYAGDDNGDDHEDWVASYGYGDDGNRTTAHLVFQTVTYDRTYHYDADERVIRLDRDNGPDGTIDQVIAFDYDDRARVTAKTTTDRDGNVIETETTSYDGGNRILAWRYTRLFREPGSRFDQTADYAYDAARLVHTTQTVSSSDDAGTVAFENVTRYDWHYDHCQ